MTVQLIPTMTISDPTWSQAGLVEAYAEDVVTAGTPRYSAATFADYVDGYLRRCVPGHVLAGWAFNRHAGVMTGPARDGAATAVMVVITYAYDYVIDHQEN